MTALDRELVCITEAALPRAPEHHTAEHRVIKVKSICQRAQLQPSLSKLHEEGKVIDELTTAISR